MYTALLFGATIVVSKVANLHLQDIDPVTGQLIGFSSLTLPVILYFTLIENSIYKGTIGKRKMNIEVVNQKGAKASFVQCLLRNSIKFLPWELAHFFVFRLATFNRHSINTSGWVMAGLVGAQALAVLYVLTLFSKSHRALYERLSGTKVHIKDKSILQQETSAS